ncbi:MAG: hypothetical protein JJW01_01080 [Alphaproteobacteria bacterium]|nr:hypothetical protein [Rickettsiales bacterium]
MMSSSTFGRIRPNRTSVVSSDVVDVAMEAERLASEKIGTWFHDTFGVSGTTDSQENNRKNSEDIGLLDDLYSSINGVAPSLSDASRIGKASALLGFASSLDRLESKQVSSVVLSSPKFASSVSDNLKQRSINFNTFLDKRLVVLTKEKRTDVNADELPDSCLHRELSFDNSVNILYQKVDKIRLSEKTKTKNAVGATSINKAVTAAGLCLSDIDKSINRTNIVVSHFHDEAGNETQNAKLFSHEGGKLFGGSSNSKNWTSDKNITNLPYKDYFVRLMRESSQMLACSQDSLKMENSETLIPETFLDKMTEAKFLLNTVDSIGLAYKDVDGADIDALFKKSELIRKVLQKYNKDNGISVIGHILSNQESTLQVNASDLNNLRYAIDNFMENQHPIENSFSDSPDLSDMQFDVLLKRRAIARVKMGTFACSYKELSVVGEKFKQLSIGSSSSNQHKDIVKMVDLGKNALLEQSMLAGGLTDIYSGVSSLRRSYEGMDEFRNSLTKKISKDVNTARYNPSASNLFTLQDRDMYKLVGIVNDFKSGTSAIGQFDFTPSCLLSARLRAVESFGKDLPLFGNDQDLNLYDRNVKDVAKDLVIGASLATDDLSDKEVGQIVAKSAALSRSIEGLGLRLVAAKHDAVNFKNSTAIDSKKVSDWMSSTAIREDNVRKKVKQSRLGSVVLEDNKSVACPAFGDLRDSLGFVFSDRSIINSLVEDVDSLSQNNYVNQVDKACRQYADVLHRSFNVPHAVIFTADGEMLDDKWIKFVCSNFNIKRENALELQEQIIMVSTGQTIYKDTLKPSSIGAAKKNTDKPRDSLLAQKFKPAVGDKFNTGNLLLDNFLKEEVSFLRYARNFAAKSVENFDILMTQSHHRRRVSKLLQVQAEKELHGLDDKFMIEKLGKAVVKTVSSAKIDSKDLWREDPLADARVKNTASNRFLYLQDPRFLSDLSAKVDKMIVDMDDKVLSELIKVGQQSIADGGIYDSLRSRYVTLSEEATKKVESLSSKRAAIDGAAIFAQIAVGSLVSAGFIMTSNLLDSVEPVINAPLTQVILSSQAISDALGNTGGFVGADPILSKIMDLLNSGSDVDYAEAVQMMSDYFGSFQNITPEAAASIIAPVWQLAIIYDSVFAQEGLIDSTAQIISNVLSSLSSAAIAAAVVGPLTIPINLISMSFSEYSRRKVVETLRKLNSRGVAFAYSIDELRDKINFVQKLQDMIISSPNDVKLLDANTTLFSFGDNENLWQDLHGVSAFLDQEYNDNNITSVLQRLELHKASSSAQDVIGEQVANFFAFTAANNVEHITKDLTDMQPWNSVSMSELFLFHSSSKSSISSVLDSRSTFLSENNTLISSPFDDLSAKSDTLFTRDKIRTASNTNKLLSLGSKIADIRYMFKSSEEVGKIRMRKIESESKAVKAALLLIKDNSNVSGDAEVIQEYVQDLSVFMGEYKNFDAANVAMMSVSMNMHVVLELQRRLASLEKLQEKTHSTDADIAKGDGRRGDPLVNRLLSSHSGGVDFAKASGQLKNSILVARANIVDDLKKVTLYTDIDFTPPIDIAEPIHFNQEFLGMIKNGLNVKAHELQNKYAIKLLNKMSALADRGFQIGIEHMVPSDRRMGAVRSDILEMIKEDQKDDAHFSTTGFELRPKCLIQEKNKRIAGVKSAEIIISADQDKNTAKTTPYAKLKLERTSVNVNSSLARKARNKISRRFAKLRLASTEQAEKSLSVLRGNKERSKQRDSDSVAPEMNTIARPTSVRVRDYKNRSTKVKKVKVSAVPVPSSSNSSERGSPKQGRSNVDSVILRRSKARSLQNASVASSSFGGR